MLAPSKPPKTKAALLDADIDCAAQETRYYLDMGEVQKHLLSVIVSMTITASASAGSLEAIKVQDFLKLPQEYQTFYVSGILDGMSFISYNYEIPSHDAWVACVRTKPLGDMVDEVLVYLKAHPEEQKYPVPWGVAKAIGQRNCER